MKFQKIGAAIAAAGMIASVSTPAFAETILLDGNGAFSDNTVAVVDVNLNAVHQENKTTGNTVVFNASNTGVNEASGNTGGGNVDLTSGNIVNKTKVTVTGADNETVLPDPCACETTPEDITISGNSFKTDNTVAVVSANLNFVGQKNSTKANTAVVNFSNTGKNKVKYNTGAGKKTVTTGKVKNKTKVKVTGGSNILP